MNKLLPTKKLVRDVRYRILLQAGEEYYKIGRIIIQRFSGDNYYVPSQRGSTGPIEKLKRGVIDKVSSHASGQAHFKMQSGEYVGIQNRQQVRNTGFQEIVRDTILDFQKLPRFLKSPDKLDVIFCIDEYRGSIQFIFSMVSGRLIAEQYKVGKVPIKRVNNGLGGRLIGFVHRCLGYESDNADKLLQHMLIKYMGDDDLPSGRRVFVPADSKISRHV